MAICCCSMAGTKACENCNNGYTSIVYTRKEVNNMSYGFNNPCGYCKKSEDKDNSCEDAKKIQEAITTIHLSNDGTHQGCGTITLMCTNLEKKEQ